MQYCAEETSRTPADFKRFFVSFVTCLLRRRLHVTMKEKCSPIYIKERGVHFAWLLFSVMDSSNCICIYVDIAPAAHNTATQNEIYPHAIGMAVDCIKVAASSPVEGL